MSVAGALSASSEPPAAVRVFSREVCGDDRGREKKTPDGGSSEDRPDDQLERLCGECCVPLDDLDDNDTLASDAEYFKTVVWTAVMGTAVDVVLTVIKFAAGLAFASSALTADAVHSASDVVSDLVVIAAARYASVPPDAKYPYGRGRWEAVATLFVSVALAWAASTLAWEFAERLVAAHSGPLDRHLSHPAVHPGSAQLPTTRNVLLEIPAVVGGVSSTSSLDDISMTLRTEDATAADLRGRDASANANVHMDSAAVLVALISVAVKEAAFQVTSRIADRIGSKVLAANAWHHRSDVVAAFAALVGVAGAAAGFAWLDAAAGVVVSLLVLRAGWEIGRGATLALVDANAADGSVEAAVRAAASEALGMGPKSPMISGLRARRAGRRIHVDCWVEIEPATQTSLADAMRRIEELRTGVGKRLGNEAGDVTVQLRWKDEAYSARAFMSA